MNYLHRWLRKLIHLPILALGFRLIRAPRFERVLRAWELEHDDFYFLQVGAHNGVTSDPFHRFVIEGWWWSVALVEPQSRSCEVLREIYRDRIHLKIFETAVGTEEVIASHTDRIDNLEQWIVEEKVSCRTLASIYQEAKFSRLDLLAIDVEGFDFEVVKQIDGLPHLPKMIYFEHRHLSESDYQSALAFLKHRGYRTENPEQGDTFAWR
jgi:FkbM family methyltransferase